MTKLFTAIVLLILLSACAQEVGEFLFNEDGTITQPSEPEASTKNIIVVTGQDANHRGVSAYEIDGTPIGVITDFRLEASVPRGIVPFDLDSFLITLDGADGIHRVFMDGTTEIFHSSASFNGALFDIVFGNNRYYALESNRIEVFDTDGINLPTAQIDTTTGSCVLSAPRGLSINSDNKLTVTSITNDEILVYDITNDTVTCDSNVFFGNAPYGVLEHSNGFLYITTFDDDRVYRADPDGSNATVIWDTNLTLINNPTGLVEMENGDLLVISSATDTIERITTDGTRVGSVPFIRDVFSLNLHGIKIIEVNE